MNLIFAESLGLIFSCFLTIKLQFNFIFLFRYPTLFPYFSLSLLHIYIDFFTFLFIHIFLSLSIFCLFPIFLSLFKMCFFSFFNAVPSDVETSFLTTCYGLYFTWLPVTRFRMYILVRYRCPCHSSPSIFYKMSLEKALNRSSLFVTFSTIKGIILPYAFSL